MKKPRRSLILFLVWFIFVSHQILPVVCETGQYIAEEEEKSSFHHVVSRTISSLKRTHQASWEKLKTIIHGVQMKFTLEAPGSGVSESVGDNMKETAKKSFETSQATVDGAAKTAAGGVHHTADKIKESVPYNKQESHTVDKIKESVPDNKQESHTTDKIKECVPDNKQESRTADKIKESVPDNKQESHTADKIKESVPDNKQESHTADKIKESVSDNKQESHTADKIKENVPDNKQESHNEL